MAERMEMEIDSRFRFLIVRKENISGHHTLY